MRKALILILTAFLIVSLFMACKNEPEPIPEITIGFEKNCEGASGEMDNVTVRKGEAANLPENKYERTDGYSFIGWNTKADGSGDSYTDGDTVCFESDTTLYAQWDKEVEKITFDCNGGSGAMFPQWVLYDEASVLRPNSFTMEGAVFVGWNTRYDGTGDAYCDSDTVRLTEDTELYAQWARDVREIKFDANGGSGWMLPQWVLYDTATDLKPNRYKMSGYHFVGWNTKADGSGKAYPDGDTVSFTENTTLYAQWGFNGVVEIKYDANGGTGWMLPQWVIKDVETVLRQNRFSKEEHFFTGWNTKADGTGDAYSDADTATFEKDTTLYAQWHTEVEKITFDSNGGGGLMFPQWVEKDEATALKPNTFSWKGHYFTGWNTEEDGSGTEYDDKAKITTDKDVVLYAQWIIDVSTMEDKTKWNESDGKYFTLSADVTIDERVEITGNITLILPEGKTLNANGGLNVSTDNALTIEGKGTLNATGGNGQAGIGGGNYESCGTVTIKDGTINATGGQSGAGIGGGRKEDEGGYGGTVNISGGNIIAIGGDSAAGIGGANDASCGTVIVTGGTVKTTGGRCGAGIGGGYDGSGGNVTISGGTLTATGGFDAAGIGGGYLYDGGGELVISGGTVTATGGSPTAAGIGGGSCGGVSGTPGKLTIGYEKIQSKSLVINSGWKLYYGDSENPTKHVDGKHNSDDLNKYAKQFMRVEKP